jgi:hypothetical protein
MLATSELNRIVRLAALGTPRTIHIGVIRINIPAATAAEDAVLCLRWFKAASAELGVNGYTPQASQHDYDIRKNEVWNRHATLR